MNKRKIVLVAVALCMVAILGMGSTMAYLQDSDRDYNTMTIGNVTIVQNETLRDGSAFVDDIKLLPAVIGSNGLSKDGTSADGSAIWDNTIENEHDKIITVTNTGTEAAYIRTILAFETRRDYVEGSSTEFTNLHDVYFGVNGDFDYLNRYVTIDGVEYCLAVKVYADPVASKATTTASLKQLFLSPDAGNEAYDIFGEKYTILAVSQAVQAVGFADAETALNAAFGDLTVVTDTDLVEWLTTGNFKTDNAANVIGGSTN